MNSIKIITISLSLLIMLMANSALAGECKALIEGLDKMNNIAQLQQVLHCLDKANINKTNTHTVQAGKPLQRAKVKHSLIKDKYLFEVDNCTRESSAVSCTVFITNQNAKTEKPTSTSFGIYNRNTSFHDEYGNEYNIAKIEIGNSQLEINHSDRNNYQLQKFMPLQVPIKSVFRFNNIPPEITTVRALNISYRFWVSIGGDGDRIITLQNIAISNNKIGGRPSNRPSH